MGNTWGRTRWQQERSQDQSREYVDRFRALAAAGEDLDGEARFVHSRVDAGSVIVDAGCGTGRVGAALAARGHRVTAVDLDPILLAEARRHESLTVIEADLATLDPAAVDPAGGGVDVVVAAGNVMVFLAPGSERAVLARLAAVLRPGGLIVLGFATDRPYRVETCVEDLLACGFVEIDRASTWDGDPWTDDASWVVLTARTVVPEGITRM